MFASAALAYACGLNGGIKIFPPGAIAEGATGAGLKVTRFCCCCCYQMLCIVKVGGGKGGKFIFCASVAAAGVTNLAKCAKCILKT